MFGKIDFIQYAIITIVLIASFTDLRWGKIYNFLTLPAALLGIVVSTTLFGITGFEKSILGILAGLLLFGWMFKLKFLGGGDVKLLMALGAWGGSQYTLQVAILSVLIGGCFSVAILLLKGRLFPFLKNIYYFALSLGIKELELQFPKVDKKSTMPFGIPMSIAAIWILFGNPLTTLGLNI